MKTVTRYLNKNVTVVYAENGCGNITILYKNVVIDRFNTGILEGIGLRKIMDPIERIVAKRYLFRRCMIQRLKAVRNMPVY